MFAYWIPACAGMTNYDAALFMSLCIEKIQNDSSGISRQVVSNPDSKSAWALIFGSFPAEEITAGLHLALVELRVGVICPRQSCLGSYSLFQPHPGNDHVPKHVQVCR